MNRRNFILFTCLFFFILSISLFSQTKDRRVMLEKSDKENRFALVIGNNEYEIGKLANAVNDSLAMKETLTKLGFDVTYIENCDLRGIKNAVQAFGKKISLGGVGLFYFAGHGFQVKGQNYILPVDVNIKNAGDIPFECYPADRIVSTMEDSSNRLNIMILDACRNNPFSRSFTRSFDQGLAQMQSGKGMLIAYATSPGQTASDGPGMNNGLFTHYLVKALKTPGLSLEKVFNVTRAKVFQASEEKQLPWTSSSVIGDFKFIPGAEKLSSELTIPDPTGVLTVSAHPFGELIIDGKSLGEVPPLRKVNLKEGEHNIIIQKGLQVFKKTINIKINKPETIYHTFEIKDKIKKKKDKK